MNDIWAGLTSAFWLIATGDADLIEITMRSLQVSLSALFIASLIALPLGTWLAIRRFRFRRTAIAVLNAMMGLPPVVVGLIVYLLLSRAGPFGVFGLLFTPTAMIIAQVVIITPLIASITHQAMRDLWAEYHDLLISLNTTPMRRILTLITDGRRALLTAALAGFGRAIGEVGAIMIVGGNIDHATRVLTTAIALETGKGDFALALGLGFVLIGLALSVNLIIHALSLKALHGLERLNTGTVTWSASDNVARTKQAYVFQSPVMLRRSVRANLAYPLSILSYPQNRIDHAIETWADRIGLSDALHRPATRLSGGEKQKLALARALIRDPEILFLDEPCSNLDGRSVKEIEGLLQAAHRAGTRIVMATHDLGQARRLATEILFLFKGRIHEVGPAPQTFDAPQTSEFKSFLNGDILV